MWWVGFGGLAAHAGNVDLQTADGIALAAESWGHGSRGVLLLHGLGRSRQDWVTLGPRLGANGFLVLAPDLRGHGSSKGVPNDAPAMTADAAAGVEWLVARGATTVHVVGADVGANLALHAAIHVADITDLVLLSPRPRAPGLELSTGIGHYDERPLLVVAGQQNALSARAADFVHRQATGHKHLQLYDSESQGTRLLNATPDLEPLVVSWINGSFWRMHHPAEARPEVETSGVGDLETKGVRLDERSQQR